MLSHKATIVVLALVVAGSGLAVTFQPTTNIVPWESESIVITTGTVEYIGIEGGFFGIVTDSGRHYDPTDLPIWYQVDGLRVFFCAIIRHDLAGVHMWGEYVDLIWVIAV